MNINITVKETYQNIYIKSKENFIKQGYSKIDSDIGSASRKANIVAIKLTWKTFLNIIKCNNTGELNE